MGKVCGSNPAEQEEGDACIDPPTVECTTAADCEENGPSISIWYPTCACAMEDDELVCSDVLNTPVGTGEWSCNSGTCDLDFSMTETDCSAASQVCGPNPDAQGDACIDPPAESPSDG